MPVAVAFGLVVVAALGILAFAGWRWFDDHDWHAAVTVDGASYSRADARNRLAILEAIDQARTEVAANWVKASLMSAAEQSRVLAGLASPDYATAVVDSFVREHAVRREAAAAGITATTQDPGAAFDDAVYAPLALHVRWLQVTAPLSTPDTTLPPSDWPRPPAGLATSDPVLRARADAMSRAAALAATTPASSLVDAARAAGWDARGGEAWIPGVDPVSGIPDTLVAALRAPGLAPGAVVGPIVDEATSSGLVGVLLGVPARNDVYQRAAAKVRMDGAALQDWAEFQQLDAALRAAKLREWETSPSEIVLDREIVIGAADNGGSGGPYAGLAHLVVSALPASDLPATGGADPSPFGGADAATTWPAAPGSTPGPAGTPPASAPPSAARSLRAMLASLPPVERLTRWDALVADANAGSEGDPLRRSGEMGWHNRDGLQPGVADAVLVPLPADSVVGPVVTSAGSELFLVRGQFLGALDDHASAALTMLATAPDLGAAAASLAPGAEALRFELGITRSELELAGNSAGREALFKMDVGSASRPFVLGGEVLVAVPASRTTGLPSGQTLDRVRVGGYLAWIRGREAQSAAVVDDAPFGERPAPSQAPALQPTVALPTMAPPPSAGLP